MQGWPVGAFALGTQPPCCEDMQATGGEGPTPTASANLPGSEVSHLQSSLSPRQVLGWFVIQRQELEQHTPSFNLFGKPVLLLIPLKDEEMKWLVTVSCSTSQAIKELGRNLEAGYLVRMHCSSDTKHHTPSFPISKPGDLQGLSPC